MRVAAAMLLGSVTAMGVAHAAPAPSEPLAIGETFTIESDALGETRRINVYRPGIASDGAELPVLYLLDGGAAEDFFHIAGLVQVLSGNGGMAPAMLVGIENTQRRRDLTGPTEVAADREIAPVVGGSAAFRRFIRDELMPEIKRRYPTTDRSALIGESLAGLFVVETLLLEPELFDTFIAVDASLWWNDGRLLEVAQRESTQAGGSRVFLASSAEPSLAPSTAALAETLEAKEGIELHVERYPDETHATVFHPAALDALRALFR